MADRLRSVSPAVWAAGLFAVALVLRVAWVLAVDRDGLPFNDTLFYHRTATDLAEGRGYVFFDEPTSRWPPVFPGLLSVVYRIFGSNELNGELMNAVVGAAAVPLLFFTALRLFGRREAVIAGSLLAIFPGQILFTDVLLAETLYTTLLVGVIAMAVLLPRDRWWVALSVGVTIGLAAETRAEGLFLVILPLAFWWRPKLRQVAILGVGVLLVVVPWTVRNLVQMDSFVPVSTNGSQTLWSGHNDAAYGGPSYTPERPVNVLAEDYSARRQELRTSRQLRREAIDWAVSHPLGELTLIPRKAAWLMRGDSTALANWVQPAQTGKKKAISDTTAVAIGNLADFFFYALAAGTLLALFLGPRVRALWLLLGASLALYCVVLYGNYRYRIPLEPVMILLVSPALARISRAERR